MSGLMDSVSRQISRNRIVEIRFNDKVEAGVSILRSCPELRDIEINGDRVLVELEADETQLAQILVCLVDEGIPLRSFNDKEPTLEDVFMMVTKGLVT